MNPLYSVCAKTNVGLHRNFNEDAMLIDEHIIQADITDYCSQVRRRSGIGTAVFVADGLGGLPGGAQASYCALETLKQLAQNGSTIFDADKIVHQINSNVIDEGYKKRMPQMSTTLSGILLQEKQITILNVGDSRVYQFQSNALRCLTRDHNLGNAPNSDGGSRHMLTNCVGSNRCYVDTCTIPYPDSDALFMICSDGLHGYVSDEAIGQSIKDHRSDLQICTDQLVNASLQAGGWDNVSVIVLKIG